MKIKDVYLSKGSFLVSTIIAVLCVIVTVISQFIPSTFLAFAFTYPLKYPWQVISYQFLHGYIPELIPEDFPYSAAQITVGHLVFNLLLCIPFGILVEKVIGSRRFLVLTLAAWLVDIVCSFIAAVFATPKDDTFICLGASGLVFSFMPVGVYILFVLGQKYGFRKLLKQVLFYLLMPMTIATLAFALSPNAGGVTGIWSMVIHLLGLGCGALFTVIYHKRIQEKL